MPNIEVHAHTITKEHFYYTCPFCWTKYKKNGEPSERGKQGTHFHGTGEDLSNRRTHRSTHCTKSDGGVFITIDDLTNRCDKYKIIK